ncbi:hypothetical protein like AT2G17200 [Hibiscus trionum]|uniref:Uncharacterized protein n=1 Tax=Hibiscus trionum TaxID=183268 RepID=A0A9W7HCJ7_HIBTR|nr:hypothetical protein like AT2G17200 [Hibiscus trionum]
MGAEGDSSESRPGGNGGEKGVIVNICCPDRRKFTVRANLESTVRSFKDVLAQNCDVPADQQRLFCKGLILKDDRTLQCYGLQAGRTVHVLRGCAPSSSTTPAATTNVATPNPLPRVPISFGPSGSNDRVELNFGSNDGASLGAFSFGSNDGAGLGASLFSGLNPLGGNGGLGLFGSGLPEFEQVQEQPTQNPQVAREIVSTPDIQSLMNNPELMRYLIMSIPQMREIIDRNPELGHILNDPSILRQTLEAERNPELMREMLRNTDRAMSNIEASPEGFNMLRRMYENIQEPLLNAATMAGTNVYSPGSNPFAALLGNRGNSQARDSPNSTSTTGSETTQVQTSPNTNPLPNPWSNNAGGVPAEELYATQLSQLREMGFYNTEENIRALRATAGNVHAAVERILGNSGQ